MTTTKSTSIPVAAVLVKHGAYYVRPAENSEPGVLYTVEDLVKLHTFFTECMRDAFDVLKFGGLFDYDAMAHANGNRAEVAAELSMRGWTVTYDKDFMPIVTEVRS